MLGQIAVMKSRVKTAQLERTDERAPKTIGPSAPPRKPPPAAARKSVPPPNRKSVAPPARKSVAPPAAAGKRSRASKKAEAAETAGGRRLGMRGAAPWAARHAAKHAEEAAARNLQAPKPGSARATLRTPDDGDSIKQRIGELHSVLGHIKTLRKNLHEGFFQLGIELKRIQEEKLYAAKGFSSFEAFAERELELGKATALKLTRIPSVFLESAARQFGMEAALAALDVLDEFASNAPQRKSSPTRPNLPLKPPK